MRLAMKLFRNVEAFNNFKACRVAISTKIDSVAALLVSWESPFVVIVAVDDDVVLEVEFITI